MVIPTSLDLYMKAKLIGLSQLDCVMRIHYLTVSYSLELEFYLVLTDLLTNPLLSSFYKFLFMLLSYVVSIIT